jgi:hypothetical protein
VLLRPPINRICTCVTPLHDVPNAVMATAVGYSVALDYSKEQRSRELEIAGELYTSELHIQSKVHGGMLFLLT